MAKYTGGPAFARPVSDDGDRYGENSEQYYAQEGMTLRDYFAAKCCAAMVSTIRNDDDYRRMRSTATSHGVHTVSEFMANEAYKQADAMLAARDK